MYDKQVLGLAEAQAALQAIHEEASKEPELTPVAAVVVDEKGDLICLMRMDGTHAQVMDNAIRKAYTAARFRRDTTALHEMLQKAGWSLGDFGADFMSLPGGVAITKPGVDRVRRAGEKGPDVFGGIGVGGRRAEEDEALALVGLKALQKVCWGKSD